jgi:hypothetical protein
MTLGGGYNAVSSWGPKSNFVPREFALRESYCQENQHDSKRIEPVDDLLG